MSVTPGPVGDAVLDAERPLRRGPRVEDRVHVADEQDPRRRRAGRRTSPTTVSPSRPAGSGRRSTVGAEAGEEAGRPAPTSLTPGRRVAAAVDVDEALEVGEVGRQVRGDRGAQRVELAVDGSSPGRPRRSRGHWPASLRAPGGLLSCPDRATGRDPPARRPERLPARAGGQARGRHRPAADLVRPARSRAGTRSSDSGADGPAARRGRTPVAATRRPGSAACATDHGEGRGGVARPSLVRSRALDRHVPVAGRGAGPGHRPRPRSRSPSATSRRRDRPADRRPGAAARALDRADRRGRDAADVDPRRRPARARRSRSRARTARAR